MRHRSHSCGAHSLVYETDKHKVLGKHKNTDWESSGKRWTHGRLPGTGDIWAEP